MTVICQLFFSNNFSRTTLHFPTISISHHMQISPTVDNQTNSVYTDWAGYTWSGTVKQREQFGLMVEKQLLKPIKKLYCKCMVSEAFINFSSQIHNSGSRLGLLRALVIFSNNQPVCFSI